jgi:tight adherence protein C
MNVDTVAWVLAPAWGVLAAIPVAFVARRAAATARVRGLRDAPSRRDRRRVRIPAALRTVGGMLAARRVRRREARRFDGELPLVVDLLQVAVGAGATPHRALELAVRWGPPAVGAALDGALGATRVGSSLADALDVVGRDRPPLAPVTAVLVASDRLGAPAGPALTRLAQELRADLRRRAEARARTLPVKLLFPLVFLVLPAFGLLTVVPALLQALART